MFWSKSPLKQILIQWDAVDKPRLVFSGPATDEFARELAVMLLLLTTSSLDEEIGRQLKTQFPQGFLEAFAEHVEAVSIATTNALGNNTVRPISVFRRDA